MMFHFVSNINCEYFLVLIFLAGCSASTSWADSQKGGRRIWWNLMNDQSISVRTHRKHWPKMHDLCRLVPLFYSLWIDQSQSQSLTPPLLQFLLLQPMLLLHVCLEKTAIASGLLQIWRRNMHQNSKLRRTFSWIAAASEPISDSFLQLWNLIFTKEKLPTTALKSITSIKS